MKPNMNTPLPWFADGSSIRVSSTALGKPYKYPVMLFIAGADPLSERHAEANAAFIVRAVNSHDELVASCEAAVIYLEKVKELAEGLSALVPELPRMTVGSYVSELHTICSNTRKIKATLAKLSA
jgi:hypothetical protein